MFGGGAPQNVSTHLLCALCCYEDANLYGRIWRENLYGREERQRGRLYGGRAKEPFYYGGVIVRVSGAGLGVCVRQGQPVCVCMSACVWVEGTRAGRPAFAFGAPSLQSLTHSGRQVPAQPTACQVLVLTSLLLAEWASIPCPSTLRAQAWSGLVASRLGFTVQSLLSAGTSHQTPLESSPPPA